MTSLGRFLSTDKHRQAQISARHDGPDSHKLTLANLDADSIEFICEE